jgi:hypothetical protein
MDHVGSTQGDEKLVQIYGRTAEDASFDRIVAQTRESRAVAGAREMEYARHNGHQLPPAPTSAPAEVYVDAFEPGEVDPLELEAARTFEQSGTVMPPIEISNVVDVDASELHMPSLFLQPDAVSVVGQLDALEAKMRSHMDNEIRRRGLRILALEQEVEALKEQLADAVEEANNWRLQVEEQREDMESLTEQHAREMEDMERRLEIAHVRLENYRLMSENAALMKENIDLQAFRRAIEEALKQ